MELQKASRQIINEILEGRIKNRKDLEKAKHFIDLLIELENLYADKPNNLLEPVQVGIDFSDGDW